ncbi:MAG: hypothetical protein SO206_00440 [Bacilli bacterium]|nr:hypothetical protein [Bacilli bacterium]
MLKFLKKNITALGLSLIVTTLSASLIISTVSWFSSSEITNLRINSGVVSSYFEPVADSDGSQANPYVIARPVQLFNLMHLMQSNRVVEQDVNGKDVYFYQKDYYFQFGKLVNGTYQFVDYGDDGVIIGENKYSPYLNMKYYSDDGSLIPIGTEDRPFIGHIIGNNLTVKNVKIKGSGYSDVGIFGYVAEGATIQNLYFDNVTIQMEDVDFKHQNVTSSHSDHKHTDNAYVGYLAGHVYDANASFKDVYINNCDVQNTVGLNAKFKNNFGYFGCVDLNDAAPVGSEKHVTLRPNDVYNYFSSAYDNISNDEYIARNTDYNNASNTVDTGNMKVSTAVSKIANGDYYTFNNETKSGTNHNYSLSTGGYRTSLNEIKEARYGNTKTKLDPSTVVLLEKPADASTLNDGTYVYYDNDLSKWQYLKVSSTAGEISTVNFNCYVISYTDNGVKYYLKYNNGTIEGTTTVPSIQDQTNFADYFFAFKESVTSKGVVSISTDTQSAEYRLFVPAHDCYVASTIGSTTASISTTPNFDSALPIKVNGNSSQITYAEDAAYVLWSSKTTTLLRRTVAGFSGTIYSISGGYDGSTETKPNYVHTYDLVTDISSLKVDDVVTFVYKNGSTNFIMSTQAKNNRIAETITIDANNHISYDALKDKAVSDFVLGQTTKGWTFKDEDTNLYLYAAGTKSSGQNYLRSREDIGTNGWAEWTLTAAGGVTNTVTVESVGNSYVPYLGYLHGTTNTGDYDIFRCSRSSSNSPQIYKRNNNSTGDITIEHSFIYSAESISSGEKTTKTDDIYYGDIGGVTFTNVLNISEVTFNFALSQITFKVAFESGYQLVTDASNLQVGDKIVIANYANDVVAGDITSQYMAEFTATFSNDGSYITSLPNDAVVLTLGGSSGAWTLSNESGQKLGATAVKKLAWDKGTTTWSISISDNDATIQNRTSSYGRFLYNYNDARFTTYTSGTNVSMLLPQIYKYVSFQVEARNIFFGDYISGDFDPNSIDTVGDVSFYSDHYAQTTSQADFNARLAMDDSKLNGKFSATLWCRSSTVIYVKNNKSRDLGKIIFEYKTVGTSNAFLSHGGGTGPTFEGLGCVNAIDTEATPNTYSYSLNLSLNNIHKAAFCGLDANRNIVSYYDADGTVHGQADDNNIDTFVIVIANTVGVINVTNVEFSFASLPGNTGNFGEVGYRSATYNADNAFTGQTPDNTLDETIVNFYYEIEIGTISYISVNYVASNKRYTVTIYVTNNLRIYIFNYDAMVYDVYANNTLCPSGSNDLTIPSRTYDPELGWIT